ncbi:MAG: hypothetical protein Tsb005_00280 [Gammaproteobacteria bacterium]
MVVIRLSRMGAKKRPFYRIVVADRRNPRDGRYIEQIGYFNPIARGNEIRLHIEQERVQYWVGNGAQPSKRVQFLVKQHTKTGSLTATELPERPKKAKKAAPVTETNEAAE